MIQLVTPGCPHLCTESIHRTPEASAPPTKPTPPPGHRERTARRAEDGVHFLNKALTIHMLVSKTQEQRTKSGMGLNGSRSAGRAGNSSQHREDLFPYLMVIYALAGAASALNIYHHCYLHLWLHLCHPMTRYCLALTANSDMSGIACYTTLTTCCL